MNFRVIYPSSTSGRLPDPEQAEKGTTYVINSIQDLSRVKSKSTFHFCSSSDTLLDFAWSTPDPLTMFTPPSNPSGSSFTPTGMHQPRRKGGLPQRSSLSNSFSFPSTPPPPALLPDASFSNDIAFEGDSSIIALSAPTRSRMAQQGHRSMAQVSPRVRPSPRSDGLAAPVTRNGHRKSRLGDDDSDRELRTSPRKRSSRNQDDEEEERSWDMVDSMRLWRHDAIMQHLYETAAFWGDKILSWTGERLRSTSKAHDSGSK